MSRFRNSAIFLSNFVVVVVEELSNFVEEVTAMWYSSSFSKVRKPLAQKISKNVYQIATSNTFTDSANGPTQFCRAI